MSLDFIAMKLLARSGLARLLPPLRRRLGACVANAHQFSDRLLATPLTDLQSWATATEPAEPGVIDLSMSAPHSDLVPSLSTKLPSDRRGLPPLAGVDALRERIAEQMTRTRLTPVTSDEVIVTHGATGAFQLACDTFVSPGDRCVLFDPCSPLFDLSLRRHRADVRWVPTTSDGSALRFDLDRLTRALPNAKLLVFSQPNNPTGGAFTLEDLERIAYWCRRYDVLVYCDESFAPFADGALPGLGQIATARHRLLIAGSISQPYGLPAARVGWLAGPPSLVPALSAGQALGQPFVSTVAQHVALAALTDVSLDAERERINEQRQFAAERLRDFGLAPWPARAGYFLWVPVPNGERFAERLLSDHGVKVTAGRFFGPSGQDAVRVSVACDEGRLREGLTRLGESLAEREMTPV